jgi:hypothetical protein
MRNKPAVMVLSVCALWAQERTLDLRSSIQVDFPKDSPVTVVSVNMGESAASARGSAMILDLHTSLSLRNSGSQRIRGIVLQVLAQEVTPGGKASVAVPSLGVVPGETFPIRIDLRLLRPLLVGGGPLVQVSLDGVLFDDFSFYGPDRLNSRRSMTVWEMEARRDRRYFKSVLAAQGVEGLRDALVQSLARQAKRSRLDVRVSRGGPATNVEAERPVQFAFLKFPDSPIEPMGGLARVLGNEARAPSLEVRNRSDRAVRYFEIGWIIRDRGGREFLAGSVPASEPELNLAPGQSSRVLQEASLKFSIAPGRPVAIAGMTGYVSQVEFADGTIWIPSRTLLGDPRLARVVAPSPEEQRLTQLYRKKGMAALVDELKKF